MSTLDSADVRVLGPNGFNVLATFVTATPSGDGSPRTATYRITPPGGNWDLTDNGTYFILLQSNQVEDTSGNAAVGALLGSFSADLTPPTPLPPTPLPPTPPPQISLRKTFLRNGIPQVLVLDAATGALRGILTPFRGYRGLLRLALVDINGDGSADLIVKARIHGKVKKIRYDAVTLARL